MTIPWLQAKELLEDLERLLQMSCDSARVMCTHVDKLCNDYNDCERMPAALHVRMRMRWGRRALGWTLAVMGMYYCSSPLTICKQSASMITCNKPTNNSMNHRLCSDELTSSMRSSRWSFFLTFSVFSFGHVCHATITQLCS